MEGRKFTSVLLFINQELPIEIGSIKLDAVIQITLSKHKDETICDYEFIDVDNVSYDGRECDYKTLRDLYTSMDRDLSAEINTIINEHFTPAYKDVLTKDIPSLTLNTLFTLEE